MSAVLGGLRRVRGAAGLWLGTWLCLAVGAGITGRLVGFVVASAVAPFGALEPGHLLYGLLDVLAHHRGAAAGILVALGVSGVLSALVWMGLGPLIIARLAGRAWAEAGGHALRTLPAVIVQTLWHGVLRATLVLAVLLSVQPLPRAVAGGLLAIAWLWCGVALDVTRVAVVEHDASPFHLRTALRGFSYTVRRPALSVPCALMSLGQLAITATLLWLALAGLDAGTPWGARLLAALSVGLGLWRVGTVIERAGNDPPAGAPPDPEN